MKANNLAALLGEALAFSMFSYPKIASNYIIYIPVFERLSFFS